MSIFEDIDAQRWREFYKVHENLSPLDSIAKNLEDANKMKESYRLGDHKDFGEADRYVLDGKCYNCGFITMVAIQKGLARHNVDGKIKCPRCDADHLTILAK